jgi:hypothetical protein
MNNNRPNTEGPEKSEKSQKNKGLRVTHEN